MAVQKRNDELVNLLEGDFQRSKMPLMTHNGIGGFWDGAINVTSSTAITILSVSNPYRVTGMLYYVVVAMPSSGAPVQNAGDVVLNDSSELFNDGDTIVEIQVSTAGAVTVQRTAGPSTVKLKLRLDWV